MKFLSGKNGRNPEINKSPAVGGERLTASPASQSRPPAEHIIVTAPVKAAMCTCILVQLRIFQHQFIVDWLIEKMMYYHCC